MSFEKERNGKYIKTTIRDELRETVFHEIDNLDTKTFSQAEDEYEKVFIVVRQVLETNEQFCCDSEEDRLSLTQIISDNLKNNFLIKKEKR